MGYRYACADFTFPLLPHQDVLRLIGMMGFDGEDSRRWLEAGAGYVAALSDVGLFYDICRKTVDEVKG